MSLNDDDINDVIFTASIKRAFSSLVQKFGMNSEIVTINSILTIEIESKVIIDHL